jgi:hypothetical protein
LKGDFHPDDLTRLFLWLRERSYGAASIREVGDFVAHSDERTKGVVTDELRGFFAHLRLSVRNLGKTNPTGLQADFLTVTRANFAG